MKSKVRRLVVTFAVSVCAFPSAGLASGECQRILEKYNPSIHASLFAKARNGDLVSIDPQKPVSDIPGDVVYFVTRLGAKRGGILVVKTESKEEVGAGETRNTEIRLHRAAYERTGIVAGCTYKVKDKTLSSASQFRYVDEKNNEISSVSPVGYEFYRTGIPHGKKSNEEINKGEIILDSFHMSYRGDTDEDSCTQTTNSRGGLFSTGNLQQFSFFNYSANRKNLSVSLLSSVIPEYGRVFVKLFNKINFGPAVAGPGQVDMKDVYIIPFDRPAGSGVETAIACVPIHIAGLPSKRILKINDLTARYSPSFHLGDFVWPEPGAGR